MEIIYKSVNEVIPYENNPRINNYAVEQVANSIKEFGFKVPIVIDENSVIVAGHTRLKAAKKLNLETVPCIIADDLTQEQVNAFRLADNKVSELAEWDFEKLEEELNNISLEMADFGFESITKEEDTNTPVERKDLSDGLSETFEVIIECSNEIEQESIFYRLTEEGYTCRVLTL